MRSRLAALHALNALHALAFAVVVAAPFALTACADRSAPTEISHAPPKIGATTPPDTPTPDSSTSNQLDPASVPALLEVMFKGRVAKVQVPADNFSHSPDAVHPDIACPGDGWNVARCWLLYTPYLGGDNTYENPSFLFAATDSTWATPLAITNPLIPYPGIGQYNSDPDHAFDAGSQRLVQIYRVVANGFNNIMIMSTRDARQWTTPRTAFRELNHDAVSPSLVIGDDRTASMWYVRSGPEGCSARESHVVLRTARPDANDRFDQSVWSDALPTDLKIPSYVPWHLDVAPLPNGRGYVAFVAAFPVGGACGMSDLWLATSRDGTHWHTGAVPLLWRGMQVARERNMSTWYRGTIRYNAATDTLDLWPSALAGTTWSIYHTSVKLHQVLAMLDAASPDDLAALTRRMVRQGIPRAELPMP